MAGIQSVNTSTLNNAFCSKMRASDSVCKSCYASRYESFRQSLHDALTRNDSALSESILPVKSLPYFNDQFVRFNSFGELINDKHLKNLSNIARKNNHATFTLWTKQKSLVYKVFSNFEKPENLILIYSSPVINKQSKKPDFFDKVFTVYSKDKKGSEFINCGSKNCSSCRICYSQNDIVNVNEILK